MLVRDFFGLALALGFVLCTGVADSQAVATQDADAPDAGDAVLDLLYSDRGFGAPELSPSGRYLAYIQHGEGDGATDYVVIQDLDDPDPATRANAMGLGPVDPDWVRWASEDRLLISVSTRGDGSGYDLARFFEGFRFSRVLSVPRDLSDGGVVLFSGESNNVVGANLTISRVVDFLTDDPTHILMPAFQRNYYHLWRVNILTGEAEVVERGSRNTIAWFTDQGEPVMRVDRRGGGRIEFYTRRESGRGWRRTMTVRPRDIEQRDQDFEWAGSTETLGEILVRARPEGTDRLGIYRYDLETGEFLEPVAVRDDYDVAIALTGSFSGRYLGYGYIADRFIYEIEDPVLGAHYRGLLNFFGDQIEVEPVSFGGSRMVLRVDGPTEPATIYLYDTEIRSVDPLFALFPLSVETPLSDVETIHYVARDGLALTAYLTWPIEGSVAQAPLVVLPHGGPESRDSIRFDDLPQYLASQGYAVLQPNFRGSWGYGQAFLQAGHHEWGLAMQQDIDDAVDFMIASGRIDAERVCLVGFSYGAYAAVSGVQTSPDRYRCAVGGGGVYDLPAFLEQKADVGEAVEEYWLELLGNPGNADDAARLNATSPTLQASAITRPVFIYHGVEDRSTSIEQSRALRDALANADVAHAYLEEADTGHNWGRDEESHRRAFRNIRDFLADAMDGQLDSFVPQGAPAEPED